MIAPFWSLGPPSMPKSQGMKKIGSNATKPILITPFRSLCPHSMLKKPRDQTKVLDQTPQTYFDYSFEESWCPFNAQKSQGIKQKLWSNTTKPIFDHSFELSWSPFNAKKSQGIKQRFLIKRHKAYL